MEEKNLAPHEGLKLHELLTIKNLSLTKSVTMLPLITDSELKNIVQQQISSNESQIKEIKDIIEKNHYKLS